MECFALLPLSSSSCRRVVTIGQPALTGKRGEHRGGTYLHLVQTFIGQLYSLTEAAFPLLKSQFNNNGTAEAETPQKDSALSDFPLGSTIEITGICFTESGEDKKLKSLEVLLPDAGSFRLLEKPSWLTPRRLLVGLGVLLVVAVAAVIWTVMVSKRNAVLSGLIREKEAAQTELQQAHDLLEERVRERTAQLKFQITARKESELQLKAVLAERTRLTQELHDTLEQTLTGIALQLDATFKLFQEDEIRRAGISAWRVNWSRKVRWMYGGQSGTSDRGLSKNSTCPAP